MLSQAVEDYLKTIYKLQRDGAASTSDIARTLDVSAASVTNMVKRLAQLGMAEHQSYRGVTLTPAGNKIALEIIRHHRLLELYLKEVMGYGWEQLHDEAEHLEHHISEEFESKIEAMLGFPTHDPHGDPIPTRDGHVEAVADAPLTQIAPGLMPKAEVVVVEKAPFDGPLGVRIGEETRTVGFAVASNVFVVASTP
jgi:DtxR family transcriptional regulator, Mn-dependent transcriptional regulator